MLESAQMTELGLALKEEREKRNISLEEIASTTKIVPRYLEALENDRFDIMPGGFFIKGIIRTYARAIGLDPDEVLAQLPGSRGLRGVRSQAPGVPEAVGRSCRLRGPRPPGRRSRARPSVRGRRPSSARRRNPRAGARHRGGPQAQALRRGAQAPLLLGLAQPRRRRRRRRAGHAVVEPATPSARGQDRDRRARPFVPSSRDPPSRPPRAESRGPRPRPSRSPHRRPRRSPR